MDGQNYIGHFNDKLSFGNSDSVKTEVDSVELLHSDGVKMHQTPKNFDEGNRYGLLKDTIVNIISSYENAWDL